MKKLLLAIAIAAAVYFGRGQFIEPDSLHESSTVAEDAIARAFRDQTSGVQVTGEGVVIKILDDDNDGSRHQRFLVRLATGQSLLVAHNIDLAPRLASLGPGDSVAFNGVYEWNEKGGLIHWTHHDPSGQHQAGWLKHDDETYQ
jgi:hypothetical protein